VRFEGTSVSVSQDGRTILGLTQDFEEDEMPMQLIPHGRIYKCVLPPPPTVAWYAVGSWSKVLTTTFKQFGCVSGSSDGTIALAGEWNYRLYKSTNTGANWTEVQPAGNANKLWQTVSVSGNGLTMLAAVYNGRLYKSVDGGTTWSEPRPAGDANKNWQSISASSDGLTIFAGVYGGRLYKSADGGTTWSEPRPAGDANKNWQSVSVSSNGSTIIAAVNGGRLYKSDDGGSTWIETRLAGDANKSWQTVSVSGNGLTMAACVNGGRLYKSADGGASWSEPQPAGAVDKNWYGLGVSSSGNIMLAGVDDWSSSRLYKSADGGTTWSEVQPAGNADRHWQSASISSDGSVMYVAAMYDAVYRWSTPPIFSAVTSTSASATGNITATNGANATARGAIIYPYTGTNKLIGDAGVTNVSESGDFGTGTYAVSLSALTPNTRYDSRAYATNGGGTGYSLRSDFRTLANVPSAPTVNNPALTTLDVAVNVNSNPSATEFAINETSTTKFVQADGTLGATAVWQTASVWGTKTVTGLTAATTYTFKVKARNGDNAETAYSGTTSLKTCTAPSISSESTATQSQCVNGSFTAISVSVIGDGLGFQWYRNSSAENSGGTSLGSANGAQTNSYTPQATADGTIFYYCEVTGTCGTATSSISGAFIVNTCAPDAPVSLIAIPGNGFCSISFIAGPDGGSTITNYEYSTDNGTTWRACSPVVITSPVSIIELINGTTYQVKIRAINSIGQGTASSTVSVTPLTTPGMPSQLTATEASGTATISFIAGSSGGGNITNYEYSTDNGSSWTACSPVVATSPVTIIGLVNGTTYKIKIRGVNVAGSGASSAFISVKPNNTFTWLGGDAAGRNDWNNPNNWNPKSVPTSTDNVVIPLVTDKPQTSSSLSVASNGKLTINANSQVEVTGPLQNNGTIVIKSDVNGTGSLITSEPASGLGLVLVERHMVQNQWHIVSSPTGTQTIHDFLDDNIDIPIIAGASPVQYGMMDFDPTTNKWNPYFTDATTSTLGIGKGYMVRIQDPVQTLRFQGILNATANASVIAGWNCIGNPFTSAIHINANSDATNNFITINASSFDASNGALYFWDQSANQYNAINNANPAYKAAVGQGFFMKVNNGVTSVAFTPAMQVHQIDAPFKAISKVNPSVKLTAQNGTKSFTTVILYIDGTTKGLDFGYDAGLFTTDTSFSIYTKLVEDNGIKFQLQCLPTNQYNNLVIPIGLDSKAAGEIVFNAETVQLAQDCKVILEDKLTSTFTDLSTGSYKAAIAADTKGADRFFLHTGDIISSLEDQVLPEKLTAYARGNKEIRVIGEVGEGAVATLFNGLGQVVLTKKLGAGNLNIIGLPNLTSGLYLLNINDKGAPQTIKVMIRK
jgi:photosystem II stability/assembly factor-like uncharacterized protein